MGGKRESPNAEKSKGVAVCDGCESVVSVWVRSDGRVDPISPQGVCTCAEPSLQLVDDGEREPEESTTNGP
ncbi:hypothetical protein [Haloterrigena alkaliphila]|uniref:Uncharacterized protein n=1 Tax=Haloterrigena alkaliphila TaxID=2816475 RepID=A0A8A2VCW2_9EURY|nr:hypothetical protein [Haloterrigena alkaliphila]QSW98537.1 hypothetical protein J0X25_14205 [Haloterrigena alkaliphila]